MSFYSTIVSHLTDSLMYFRLLQRSIAIICIAIPFILWLTDKDKFDRQKTDLTQINGIPVGNRKIKVDTIVNTLPNLGSNDTWNAMDTQIIATILHSDTELISAYKVNKDACGFRPSISHYAYATNSFIYGMLYCMAAMLFIVNGVVYMGNNKDNLLTQILNKNTSWLNIIIGLLLIGVVCFPLYFNDCLHYFFSISFFLLNIIVIAFFENKNEKPLCKRRRYLLAGFALVFAVLPFIIPNIFSVLLGEWFSLTAIATYLFLVAQSVKAPYDSNA